MRERTSRFRTFNPVFTNLLRNGFSRYRDRSDIRFLLLIRFALLMRSVLRRLWVGAEIRSELSVESRGALIPALHCGERLSLRHHLSLSLRERLRGEVGGLRIGERTELTASSHCVDGILHLYVVIDISELYEGVKSEKLTGSSPFA